MVILGVNILGNLNKPATTQESLGLAVWRIVISSGIVVFILGFFNLIAVSPPIPFISHTSLIFDQSYLFRDRHKGITARQVRAKGASVHKTPILSSSITSAPSMRAVSPITPAKTSFNPFKRMTRCEDTLPSYHSSSPEINKEAVSPSSKYSRATCDTNKRLFFGGRKRDSVGPSLPINISAPMGINPQFAHLVQPQSGQVQRPDSAMHPSRTGESETQRFKN